jgi:uncharacterized protein YndB with AHSA1/START domain
LLRLIASQIEISRVINTSSQAVWDLITDTSRWVLWGPSFSAVECRDLYIIKGSQGRLRTPIGFWVSFVVTEYEPGKYWSWRVSGIPATGHRVETGEKETCTLVFEVPLFFAPYILVCKITLDRIASIAEH